MVLKEMGKLALITKSSLFDWAIMPFGMKNATITFSKTMIKVFGITWTNFLRCL
jgi:hypothetical protein